jgi:hypothetical protein
MLAWARAKRMLFRAGDWPERWFVTGFAAFLAGLTGYGVSWQGHVGPWSDGGLFPGGFARGLAVDPALLLFVGALSVFGLVVWVALLWVSSRARFVFLDNVVAERPAIGDPWSRYAREGNSLFLWRLLFSLVSFAAAMVVVGPPILAGTAAAAFGGRPALGLGGAALGALFGLVLGVTVAYVTCFLDSFVVPIMFRDRLTAIDAWKKFLPLLRSHPAEFVLYGLLLLVLLVATMLVLVAAGIMTCCIGLLLMALPYIGTVVLLPVWVTYRGYGAEFLAQFGPEWSIFPTPGSSGSGAGGDRPPSGGDPEPPPLPPEPTLPPVTNGPAHDDEGR